MNEQTQTEQEATPDFGGEQVKLSKVEKFFQGQRAKLHQHMTGLESHLAKKFDEYMIKHQGRLEDFIKHANEQIAASDKKFGGMYNMLIRKFLGELENRVYTTELSSKALMLMLGEKLYAIEAAKGGEVVTKEDFLTKLETEFVAKMTEIHTAAVEAANAQQAQGAPDVQEPAEVPQEPVQAEVPGAAQ